jgi:transposase-like protein
MPSSTRECPKCSLKECRRSHARGLERILRKIGFAFYRCENCQHRFIVATGWTTRQRRYLYGALAVVALLLLLWFGIDMMAARDAHK